MVSWPQGHSSGNNYIWYTSGTTVTANASAAWYPSQNVPVDVNFTVSAKPSLAHNEGPLDWLDRRIAEITELAFAA